MPSTTVTFRGVDLNVTAGRVLNNDAKVALVIPTDGYDAVSVDAWLETGAWATAEVRVMWRNSGEILTPHEHSTTRALTSAAKFTTLFMVEGAELVLWLLTAEGNPSIASFNVHLRPAMVR